jgi:hypothetical protein
VAPVPSLCLREGCRRKGSVGIKGGGRRRTRRISRCPGLPYLIQLPYPSFPSASSVVVEHGCRRRARVSLSSAGVVVGESGGARESEC